MNPLGFEVQVVKQVRILMFQQVECFRDQSQGRAHMKHIYRIKMSSEDIPLI